MHTSTQPKEVHICSVLGLLVNSDRPSHSLMTSSPFQCTLWQTLNEDTATDSASFFQDSVLDGRQEECQCSKWSNKFINGSSGCHKRLLPPPPPPRWQEVIPESAVDVMRLAATTLLCISLPASSSLMGNSASGKVSDCYSWRPRLSRVHLPPAPTLPRL